MIALGQMSTRLAKIVRSVTCICTSFCLIVLLQSLFSFVFRFFSTNFIPLSASWSYLWMSIVDLFSLDSHLHLLDKTHCFVFSIGVARGPHYLNLASPSFCVCA
jgi:hypothetical protein